MVNEDLDKLARSLRQGVGDEIRREAAEDEALTELQRRRHRQLADVARSAMHRGDLLAVEVGGQTLRCPVAGVASDYMSLDIGSDVLDVRLDGVVMRVVPNPSGGTTGRPLPAATMRARLAELEQLQAEVELVTVSGRRVSGRIQVVAADHVAVEADDATVAYLAVEMVLAVFSRNPPRRV